MRWHRRGIANKIRNNVILTDFRVLTEHSHSQGQSGLPHSFPTGPPTAPCSFRFFIQAIAMSSIISAGISTTKLLITPSRVVSFDTEYSLGLISSRNTFFGSESRYS